MASASDSTNLPAFHRGPVTRAIRAMNTEPEPPRRGFLRGLLTLPLIGGAVSLIGAPTAVAEPVTTDMLRSYVGWLGREFGEAHDELMRRDPDLRGSADRAEARWRSITDLYQFHRFAEPAAYAVVESAPPSTRAALVLSAVGCDWRR